MDAPKIISLLLAVPFLISWSRCVLGYLRLAKIFRAPRTWSWAVLPLSGAMLAYFMLMLYIISGDRGFLAGFILAGTIATLPFLLSNLESIMTSRRLRK